MGCDLISMFMGNKVVCKVWLLLDTKNGHSTQLLVSFMVYVKGASPFVLYRFGVEILD